MSADPLLFRLERVKHTGQGRWIACCPAHDDKNPSLSVRDGDDGRVLVHCFAGCGIDDILGAVGLTINDLFPERLAYNHSPMRRPFPAADVLRCIGFEALVVAVAGASLLSGHPFTQTDRERLMVAVGRIQEALTAAGVQHG